MNSDLGAWFVLFLKAVVWIIKIHTSVACQNCHLKRRHELTG